MSVRPRLGVLLSGGGRTLQNFIDRIADGRLVATIACVVSDREGAYGLVRAESAGIPTAILRGLPTFDFVRAHAVDLVCLAGYLRLLPIPPDFAGRVLNVHPALLPRFGGQGCYGDRVHSAVLASGDRESGCTIHHCDATYDTGPIVLQRRVPVHPDDTAATLAARVFAAECDAYPAAIAQWWSAQAPGSDRL